MTKINEPKTLTQLISCVCKCKFGGRNCNSDQKWNKEWRWCECKNPIKHWVCEKDYTWNPSTCVCEINNHSENIIDDWLITFDKITHTLENIIDDWLITVDKIIHTLETGSVNFNDGKSTYRLEYHYILHTFLLVTILVGINNCYCLLLLYKTSFKRKRHITMLLLLI